MNRWLIIFFAILMAGGSWLWISRVPLDAQPRNFMPEPVAGRPAPDFQAQTLAGDTLTLSALRGKPVVLNFWATWCDPCRQELPALQAAASRYEGEVVFVGVDQGESRETVQAMADQMKLTYHVPLDANLDVAHLYNVKGLPTTFFIDRDGIIRQAWMGQMNSITLIEGVAKILP